MAMHPGTRLVQLGLNSIGHDPGQADGWWGPKTQRAATTALDAGPRYLTSWAVLTLQRGLADLGWLNADPSGEWDEATRAALSAAVVAKGAARASYVPDDAPTLPAPRDNVVPVPGGTSGRIIQGGKVVDSICEHTFATPGDWWIGKSNKQMWDAVKDWHTSPKSQGGRGWKDRGYHYGIFPDGEWLRGRAETTMGAGAIGYNRGVIHISMVPIKTINRMGMLAEFYTPETIATMRWLIEDISRRTPITKLFGHNEVAKKLCPGFWVVDEVWTARAVA